MKKELLKQILLRTRYQLLLRQRGEQKSPFIGESLDFRELRPYTIDDDIRHLNWKSMAKNREPCVNSFDEYRQINIVILYLNSGSLTIGTPISKKSIALELLSALTFAGIFWENRVGSLFVDEEIRAWNPPRFSSIEVDRNFEIAKSLKPFGDLSYSLAVKTLENSLKKPSLIFLIGDFMDISNIETLNSLATIHEIYALIIRDSLDEELILGEYLVEDAKSNKKRLFNIDKKAQKAYKELITKQDKKLFSNFKNNNILWEKFYTNEDVIVKLIAFLRGIK